MVEVEWSEFRARYYAQYIIILKFGNKCFLFMVFEYWRGSLLMYHQNSGTGSRIIMRQISNAHNHMYLGGIINIVPNLHIVYLMILENLLSGLMEHVCHLKGGQIFTIINHRVLVSTPSSACPNIQVRSERNSTKHIEFIFKCQEERWSQQLSSECGF